MGDDDDLNRTGPKTIVDRIFALLEGPIATTLMKLIATVFICVTTISLTGILALTNASVSLLMSTVGLGLGATAVTWVFGGWGKKAQIRSQTKVGAEARKSKAEIAALTLKLTELEERLSNVEVIERFEDRLAAKVADSTPGTPSSGAETTYRSSGIDFE